MPAMPHVLIVDDDATTRRIHSGSLAASGIPCDIVSSAEEAQQILETRNVDVIVTDLIMPKYSGVDLITAVRECDYTRHIPILVLTAGGSLELIQQAVNAGATEILQKHSCPPTKLVARILELAKDAR